MLNDFAIPTFCVSAVIKAFTPLIEQQLMNRVRRHYRWNMFDGCSSVEPHVRYEMIEEISNIICQLTKRRKTIKHNVHWAIRNHALFYRYKFSSRELFSRTNLPSSIFNTFPERLNCLTSSLLVLFLSYVNHRFSWLAMLWENK